MKTLGVVGGLGPESTIDYYRLLIAAYQKRVGEKALPSILINSIDVYRGLGFLDTNDLVGLADYLTEAVDVLAVAGADFAILSANSPHLVFADVQRRSPIPLLSIVEAACAETRARGMNRVGLLGTRFTMQARFYPEVFSQARVTLTIPNAGEIDWIHDKYINELLKGIFLPETRARLLEVIARMREEDGIEAVVLAGTELPLILRDGSGNGSAGVPLLDTTQIHVEAAIERLLQP
jgi:aspartate racemase